jgi:hypothetical protein
MVLSFLQPTLEIFLGFFPSLNLDFLARIIHEGSSRKRADAKRAGHPEP